MINFDFSNSNKPQTGSILISEPFMFDDHFSRSVVFLCEHNDKGSFGFVLNKYIETPAEDLIPEFNNNQIKISIGGPVDKSNLYFVHTLGDKLENAIPISGDLFIGGDFEQLKEIINKNPQQINRVRFFIGYSGWSPGQLQEEMDEKSWVVVDNIPSDVILDTSNDTLWKSLMKKLGGKFEAMINFPRNPSDN